MEDERLDDALALLENAIYSDPSDWNAIYLSGFVLRGKGDLRGAVHRYEQGLNILSDADSVHHALGVAYQQLGQYASAISAFQSALRLKPGRFETLNSLGLTYKLAGDYHQAIDLRRIPDNSQNFFAAQTAVVIMSQLKKMRAPQNCRR